MANTGSPLRVYALDDLPPEVVAVTFAKTSRSPEPLDAIARELSETESSRFHEKWVIGYGHSSIAEHAVLSVAIENVSILGAKIIEENRLSSFTEKSTRYQVMDAENYYTPRYFESGPAGRIYGDGVARLFATYSDLMPRALGYCEERFSDPVWRERGIRPSAKACDMLRGLVPAAAKTNLGWTINSRSLRHALVKMASSPLSEMREVAAALAHMGREKVPALLRHIGPSPYLTDWERRMAKASRPVLGEAVDVPAEPRVTLVAHDPDAEDAVLTAVLFRATGRPYGELRSEVLEMSLEAKAALLNEALSGIGEHEPPVRELENANYTFEIIVDFGAYRDIQRHRMTTQTQQPLSCDLGYTIPDDAHRAGLAPAMERALEETRERWRELSAVDSVHAQYAVPLAFHKRFLISMNLREAYHMVRLRSRIQGHESYRRVAWAIKREIERVHPVLGALIPAEVDERERVATPVAASGAASTAGQRST
jgi:thymidylate synthase ThyX